MKLIIYLLASSVILRIIRCQLDVPVVITAFGAVRGVYEEDEFGQFFSYMGIPYAQAPPGNMFGDPIDPTPWEGVLDVNDEKNMCPQRMHILAQQLNGVLECLLLNVYVPANRTSSEPLSVFFWLHGGRFLFGSYTRDLWSPEFLLSHDVIVVTINYRMGPLGKLCAGTKEAPGNAGYKDMVHGLKWIQSNIASFGGNPNEVTLGGCSSGSMSVEFILSSPMAAGLFQRVIMMSGTSMGVAFSQSHSHTKAVIEMANFLGYRGGTVSGSFQFLQQLEPLTVVYASENVGMTFSVCAENEIDGVENFLTEPAMKIIESGNFTPVDTLLGFTSKEIAFTIHDIVDESYEFIIHDAVDHFRFSNAEDKTAVAEVIIFIFIFIYCKLDRQALQTFLQLKIIK